METPEAQIKRLEEALKTAKLKIWVTSIIGIIGGISLFGAALLIGIHFGGGSNEPIMPDPNILTIPLGTPPDDFGRRIPPAQNPSVEDGFTDYLNMLNSGNEIIIPNSTNTPDTVNLDTILYPKYELISVEALAQMLKIGQISGTTGIIQPAFIRIQDCKMVDSSGSPIIKKYLMMVDRDSSIIEDSMGRIIYYNELRRCPPNCLPDL